MPARAPVTNLWQAGRKARQREARHRAPSMALKRKTPKVRRRHRKRKVIHTPVRVGSAAMPAPFALRAVHIAAGPIWLFARVESHKIAQSRRSALGPGNGSSRLALDSCLS